MTNLALETKQLIKQEQNIAIETVLKVGKLHRLNVAVNLGYSHQDFAEGYLGLSASQYWKRVQAAKVIRQTPEFLDLIKAGETHISHVALLAPMVTAANRELLLQEIKGKSKTEVQNLVKRVTRDGKILEMEPEVEMTLRLKKSDYDILIRAKEVLMAKGKVPNMSEVVVRAAEHLLKHKDPMEKAKRAAAKLEAKAQKQSIKKVTSPTSPGKKRKYIPMSARHQLWLKNIGQCSHTYPNGKRCQEGGYVGDRS